MDRAERRLLARSLKQYKAGESAALAKIYEVLATPVYYAALRMRRDRASATELTRDVLLELFADIGKMHTPETLWASAMRLTYQRGLGQLPQGESRCQSAPAAEMAAPRLALPQEYAHDPRETRRVIQALDALGDEARAVSLLFHYNGLTAEEISAALGHDAASVHRQLNQASRSLEGLIFGTQGGAVT